MAGHTAQIAVGWGSLPPESRKSTSYFTVLLYYYLLDCATCLTL